MFIMRVYFEEQVENKNSQLNCKIKKYDTYIYTCFFICIDD